MSHNASCVYLCRLICVIYWAHMIPSTVVCYTLQWNVYCVTPALLGLSVTWAAIYRKIQDSHWFSDTLDKESLCISTKL